MTLNVYDKVINIEPLNDEAKTVLKHTDVKGMDISDTVEVIINESRQEGYINDNGADVIVSVVPGIRAPKIADKNTSDNVNFVVNTSNNTELQEAKDMGVSIAKAKAIEEYSGEFGGTVSDNANKLSGKTVKQIETEIAEKKKAEPSPQPAETASPQTNGNIMLQSVAKPASQADRQPASKPVSQSAPKPTSSPAQIFTPSQLFTPAPAKDRDESDNYSENKAEDLIPEQKPENPKPESEIEKPQNSESSEMPSQPKADEQRKKTEQSSGDKAGDMQPSGTQAEPLPQNNEPSTPVQSESGHNNGAAPATQKEPEQKDTVPSEPAQKQPEQKENVPSGGGNAAPSDNGGTAPSKGGSSPSQPSASDRSAPLNNGGDSSGTNGGNAPTGGNGGAPSGGSGGNGGGAPSGGGNGGGPSGGGPR